MRSRFDLVVFDWDGTVVNSTAMIARCIQKAATDMGLTVPSLERASHVIGLGLRDALAGAVPDLAEDRIELFTDRYRYHYLSVESEIVLFAGVRELLVELVERGVRLAIATGKNRRGLDRALESTGLRMFFQSSRCADETHPKPHPAMLLELTEELSVAVDRTVMIGDTSHDLAMAVAAGTQSIAVTYGAHPRDQLAAHAPIALVDTFGGLRPWLLSD